MKKKLKISRIIVALICIIIIFFLVDHFNLIPKKYYTDKDFGIKDITSPTDYNDNGKDDYSDIMLGARKDAATKPKYDGTYCAGGYPQDDRGVCTDVVWRAFKNAGYSLKDMVDRDIKENIKLYPRVEGQQDTNIDFRRVPNLKVFFEKYAVSLTLDTTKIEEWQQGDIITYGTEHIAIVSDRRNAEGISYIIHNSGQPVREEDALIRRKISGHFRFDASRLDKNNLIAYIEP